MKQQNTKAPLNPVAVAVIAVVLFLAMVVGVAVGLTAGKVLSSPDPARVMEVR